MPTAHIWVTNDGQLAELCNELSDSALAIDTEFTRRTTFYAQLALIQIAAGDRRILIDPLCIDDWLPMQNLLANSHNKIFHAALEDLEVFRTDVGVIPEPLFDTQIGAAFCGLGDSLSYADLVEFLHGIELSKAETQSDWMRRPLSESQVGYALDDVEWLQQIAQELTDRLHNSEKLDWMQDYCLRTVENMRKEIDPKFAYRKLKGNWRLSPDQLRVAAHLCTWREISARSLDKPKSWIIRDPVILEIARKAPQNLTELEHRAGLAPESVRRYGRQLLSEIEDAFADAQEVPAPSQPIEGVQRKQLKALQQKVEALAQENQISKRLIASKSDLEGLIRWQLEDPTQAKPLMLQDWRANTLAPQLISGVS
jgi:ribonuclease D|tara:strand:+ start:40055 stop:41161 length:1107 start_codon:yes stop_codon:yes gene_type:complete